MEVIARLPKFWFWTAVCALVPVQIWFVVHDPWFFEPPKPIGDGPDYENIAYHLSKGRGWSMDWTDPGWQQPYRDASLPHAQQGGAADASDTEWPIADYSVQLQRVDPLAPTTARPPLLPLINAMIYAVVPRGPIAFATMRVILATCIAVASSVAVAISVRVVSQLSVRWWPPVLAAMVTMALAVLDRTVRTYATDFLTEPLAMVLTQFWVWSLCELLLVPILHQPKSNRGQPAHLRWQLPWQREWWLVASSGVLLGLMILTRSLMVLWLPGIWLMIVLATRIRYRSFFSLGTFDRVLLPTFSEDCRRATAIVAIAMLVCLPWWVRNCVVLQTFMPLGTQGPITLVGGYNDDAIAMKGQWHLAPETRLRRTVEPEVGSKDIMAREVHVARRASKQVKEWMRGNLNKLPYLAWVRLKNEWNPYNGRALAFRLAALVGLCWLCTLHRSAALLLGGVIIVNSITVMMLYSVGGRFIVPTYGILYTLAGIGIGCTASWKRLARVD